MLVNLKKANFNTFIYFYVSLFAFYFSVNLLNGIFRKYTPKIYSNLVLLFVLSVSFALLAAHLSVPEDDRKKFRKGEITTAAILAE